MRVFLLIVLTAFYVHAGVTIWEQDITIPSYGVEKPDPNPRFYTGRTYQGAQGRIYPYPMSDVLTNQKADRSYRAVFLENEYIRLSVLPEIGGRIFTGVDKTNNYDFFYRQSVIKPSLIGMLGQWISGGVEWNFPHHHRADTYIPMHHHIEDNPDGSKTLYLSEIERRHRMRLLVAVTVFPQKSIFEVEITAENRTPFVHSMLYFANPAVHVDSSYQVIFPPETEYVTQHAKREFSEWPVSNSRYGGREYENVDISWWKNLTKPVSFFCWDPASDYFAGYDHGRDAGVAYVSNIHMAPGMKFFTFGCGDQGGMWDAMLTDTDGPYLELMAGAWSDNQPDYSWIQPFEVKSIKQYWFPVRDLGGLSYAGKNGALKLELNDGRVVFRCLTTSPQENASVRLFAGREKTVEKTVTLAPDRIFAVEADVAAGVKETDLVAVVRDSAGNELLRFSPAPKPGTEKPQPVVPPGDPEKINTVEELYLAGLRLDQFYNPAVSSMPYYEEALRRDSCHYDVNTQLGIKYCKQGRFEQAEQHLQTAVDRASRNYTRPRDGEALYYLGVAQTFLGKTGKAYDTFYRAVWSFPWRAAGYTRLAELDCRNGDPETALQHINLAVAANTHSSISKMTAAVILRKLGRYRAAVQICENVLSKNPLDLWAVYELGENLAAQGRTADSLHQAVYAKIGGEKPYALELAWEYARCGFYRDGLEVLTGLPAVENPMVFYTAGHFSRQMGDMEGAQLFCQNALQLPADYCFPFRLESIAVLEGAMAANPMDARAPLYLGNLLFDRQPEKAIACWEIARDLDPDHYMAYRNLGFACDFGQNDLTKAIAAQERAVKLAPEDARLLYELDRLYAKNNAPLKKRLRFLQSRRKVVEKRDDATARLVELWVQAGDYNRALDVLTTRHFNTWEGGGRIHDVYVDACMLRGIDFLRNKKYGRAAADFNAALLYPRNLEVGRPLNDPKAIRALYYLGLTARLQGDHETAQTHFKRAAQIDAGPTVFRYHQGECLNAMGREQAAAVLFDELITDGRKTLETGGDINFFAKFDSEQAGEDRARAAYVNLGLGYLGKGETDKAREALEKTQQMGGENRWLEIYLAML